MIFKIAEIEDRNPKALQLHLAHAKLQRSQSFTRAQAGGMKQTSVEARLQDVCERAAWNSAAAGPQHALTLAITRRGVQY